MLAGRVEAALTSEPGTTAGVLPRGAKMAASYAAPSTCRAAWGEMTGAAPVLPQAGLAVTQGFLDDHGAALPDLLAALEAATVGCAGQPGGGGCQLRPRRLDARTAAGRVGSRMGNLCRAPGGRGPPRYRAHADGHGRPPTWPGSEGACPTTAFYL